MSIRRVFRTPDRFPTCCRSGCNRSFRTGETGEHDDIAPACTARRFPVQTSRATPFRRTPVMCGSLSFGHVRCPDRHVLVAGGVIRTGRRQRCFIQQAQSGEKIDLRLVIPHHGLGVPQPGLRGGVL